MNEWCIYIALYCVLLYTQSALQSCVGGSLLNHHQCAASTWMMRRLPQDNIASALTSYKWREERVIEPIKKICVLYVLFTLQSFWLVILLIHIIFCMAPTFYCISLFLQQKK